MAHKDQADFRGPFPPAEMLRQMGDACSETRGYLDEHPDLDRQLSGLWSACYYVLYDAPPSDFVTLERIGGVPFSEAVNEVVYAINFALLGVYKTAFEKLRGYLELNLLGVYFADQTVLKEDAKKWVWGHVSTPFMSNLRKALFKRPHFVAADHAFSFHEDLVTTYHDLCDYVHTRGYQSTHFALSGTNLPGFSAQALRSFVAALGNTTEAVAIALGLQFPIILQPLPISAKFGLNPPVSGFLEEHQVRILEGLISDDKLEVLRQIRDNDPWVQGARAQIESMPDLTDEEVRRQADEQAEMINRMSSASPRGSEDVGRNSGNDDF